MADADAAKRLDAVTARTTTFPDHHPSVPIALNNRPRRPPRPFPSRHPSPRPSACARWRQNRPGVPICHGRILRLARVGRDTAPTGSLPRHPYT
eukprot:scaffold26743_cov105-Isochrysis_galbana.AAC.2